MLSSTVERVDCMVAELYNIFFTARRIHAFNGTTILAGNWSGDRKRYSLVSYFFILKQVNLEKQILKKISRPFKRNLTKKNEQNHRKTYKSAQGQFCF